MGEIDVQAAAAIIYAFAKGRPPPALFVNVTVLLFPLHAKSDIPVGLDVKLSFLPSFLCKAIYVSLRDEVNVRVLPFDQDNILLDTDAPFVVIEDKADVAAEDVNDTVPEETAVKLIVSTSFVPGSITTFVIFTVPLAEAPDVNTISTAFFELDAVNVLLDIVPSEDDNVPFESELKVMLLIYISLLVVAKCIVITSPLDPVVIAPLETFELDLVLL